MKLSVAWFAVALAGSAIAQSIPVSGIGATTTCVAAKPTSSPDCSVEVAQIPSCALNCFSNAVAAIGCSHSDYVCQCSSSNKAALSSNAMPCVQLACSASDVSAVQAAAKGLCNCASDWAEAHPVATTCYTIGGGGGSMGVGPTGSIIPSLIPSFYTPKPIVASTTTTIPYTTTKAVVPPASTLTSTNSTTNSTAKSPSRRWAPKIRE